MRSWILCTVLAVGLAAAAAIRAQDPATEAEARSHILSAFMSGADPRLFADGVILGPTLQQHLAAAGPQPDGRKVYDALMELSSGKPLRLRALTPGEVVRYASLTGVNAGEPLFALQAGDTVLLLQYASRQKNVSFVEQLGGAAPPAIAATAPVPKPQPIVEVPLPAVPPPAVPEPPKPPPVAAEKPKPAPITEASPPAAKPAAAPAPKPAAARVETPRPRGECVIKPVMSDDDMRDCAAVPTPRAAAVERPAPPISAEKPPVIEAPRRTAECVIKPVMSDEDLRNCGVRPR